MAPETHDLMTIVHEMRVILSQKIIPFWLYRAVDTQYGGYVTAFDSNGVFSGNDTKYIVTQCRMLWGLCNLLYFAREQDLAQMKQAAKQGADFIMQNFWDREHGGMVWQLNRDGSVADDAKLVYGESFSIYALSEYYLQFKDHKALSTAETIFNLLQIYAADTRNGGYLENLERDWSPSPGRSYAGNRKSLDVHMHLMEAFTTLCMASGNAIHQRKLLEILDLIMGRMVNSESGFGYNQFSLAFKKLPAINILRTWNAERETHEKIAHPTDSTSYGHNAELSWLASLALDALNLPLGKYQPVLRKLLDHSLEYGYDHTYGGVFRDGIANQPALVKDKEWWQNFEAMVGYLNGYQLYGDIKYLDAFRWTWTFIQTHFLHPDLGESYQLLDREGNLLVGNLGNAWKGVYHTGRALAECIRRINTMTQNDRTGKK